MPIKVLVVDDSALVRSLLSEIIRQSNQLELVGAAPDPFVARDMIKALNPDVITLDIEMPRMDGLTFLEKLMQARPMPVLMISTLTHGNAEATFRALELGAVDFIEKPKLGIVEGIRDYAEMIVDKLIAAASVNVTRLRPQTVSRVINSPRLYGTEKIIAIGASTGGTEAIKEVLLQFPSSIPGIVIAQHMPPGFTRSFSERLNRLTRLTVVEAKGDERILPGYVFVAPGDRHLEVVRSGADYRTRLSDAPPVRRHKPAVDVLFESVAEVAGRNGLGIILTGMGKDGAAGIKHMHDAGAITFAQDEASCVVFGMPKEAIAQGAIDHVVPLDAIGEKVIAQLNMMGRGNRV